MKALLILLLLTSAAQAQITTKTDEFTGNTTMSGEANVTVNDSDHISSMMALRIDGQTYIILSTASTDWVHLADETGYLIHGASKARITLKAMKISTDTEISDGTLILTENIAFKLTTHTLYNPVRIRFGTVIYDVPEQVVADVRAIGARLR